MASVTAAPPAPVTAAPQAKRNYAKIAEQTWIWSTVGYAVVRFLVAWGAFSEHGANVWIFGILDVGTAWPYAKSIATVCKRAAANQWKQLPIPLTVALVSFFAPYAYLWFAAGEMPAGVRIGMAIFVSVLLLAATAGVLAKTRKLRKQDQSPESVVDIDLRDRASEREIIIDLTGETASIERTPTI